MLSTNSYECQGGTQHGTPIFWPLINLLSCVTDEKWAKLNWQHHLGGSSCFLFFGRLLLLWKLAALVLAKNLEQTPVPTHFAAMHFLNFSDTDLECLSCPHFLLPFPVTVSGR